MRNFNRVVFGTVVKVSALSLALIAAAQAAGGIGFQVPRSPAGQEQWVAESSGAATPIGFQLPKDPSIRERDVAEAYPGVHAWTDSLKCMTSEAYCHRLDTAPVKAGLAAR